MEIEKNKIMLEILEISEKLFPDVVFMWFDEDACIYTLLHTCKDREDLIFETIMNHLEGDNVERYCKLCMAILYDYDGMIEKCLEKGPLPRIVHKRTTVTWSIN